MATVSSKKTTKQRTYSVVIERDADGYYVGTAPELHGCHTQAKSLDKLLERVREAIQVCLDAQGEPDSQPEFIGIQQVLV